jgi:hypothetical protein
MALPAVTTWREKMAWTVLVVFVMAIVRAGRMRRTAPGQDQFFKLFCYSNVASLDANTRDFITSTKSMRSYLTSRGHDDELLSDSDNVDVHRDPATFWPGV